MHQICPFELKIEQFSEEWHDYSQDHFRRWGGRHPISTPNPLGVFGASNLAPTALDLGLADSSLHHSNSNILPVNPQAITVSRLRLPVFLGSLQKNQTVKVDQC